MNKRRGIYDIINDISDFKQNFSNPRIMSDPEYDEKEIITHTSVFLRIWGYLPENSPVDPSTQQQKRVSVKTKENFRVMHAFNRVLKRYFTIYNILMEVAEVLTGPFKTYFSDSKYAN